MIWQHFRNTARNLKRTTYAYTHRALNLSAREFIIQLNDSIAVKSNHKKKHLKYGTTASQGFQILSMDKPELPIMNGRNIVEKEIKIANGFGVRGRNLFYFCSQ